MINLISLNQHEGPFWTVMLEFLGTVALHLAWIASSQEILLLNPFEKGFLINFRLFNFVKIILASIVRLVWWGQEHGSILSLYWIKLYLACFFSRGLFMKFLPWFYVDYPVLKLPDLESSVVVKMAMQWNLLWKLKMEYFTHWRKVSFFCLNPPHSFSMRR